MKNRLLPKRYLLSLLFIIPVSSVSISQELVTDAKCGMQVEYLTDQPKLISFPAKLQTEIKSALADDIAAERKLTGADESGNDENTNPPLETSLRLFKIPSTISRAQLYLVWWNVPLICGMHANCPIWLVEVNKHGVHNLFHSHNPQDPSNTLGTGWGVGLRTKGRGDYPDIMIAAHGYRPEGGPAVWIACWHKDGKFYVAGSCPVACDRVLNAGQN